MQEIIKRFYQKKSASYEDDVNTYWNFDRSQITEILRESIAIIELGVGTGLNIPFYPDGARVTAIDLSEKMVSKARLKVTSNQNVNFFIGDVMSFSQEFPVDTFNGVIATYYFSVTPSPGKDLEILNQIVENGSPVVIIDHAKNNPNLVQKFLGKLIYRTFYFNPYRDLASMFLRYSFQIHKKIYLGKFGRTLKNDVYLFVLKKI